MDLPRVPEVIMSTSESAYSNMTEFHIFLDHFREVFFDATFFIDVECFLFSFHEF